MAFRLVVTVEVPEIDGLYEIAAAVVAAVAETTSQVSSLRVEAGKAVDDV